MFMKKGCIWISFHEKHSHLHNKLGCKTRNSILFWKWFFKVNLHDLLELSNRTIQPFLSSFLAPIIIMVTYLLTKELSCSRASRCKKIYRKIYQMIYYWMTSRKNHSPILCIRFLTRFGFLFHCFDTFLKIQNRGNH